MAYHSVLWQQVEASLARSTGCVLEDGGGRITHHQDLRRQVSLMQEPSCRFAHAPNPAWAAFLSSSHVHPLRFSI